ncbi:hypothetical protein EXU57_20855 [Segetibacter sp. 3557_3]|uniref:polysaccharide biosynthesis/export family protein n=1 Tax=Segetibacter sp. 3557_3 TaxID=2547429 RepID=UPI0010587321|nr:polysaccharide biosynthesis/export family protein [Segetibacter sp. 3557_3]TDH20846.1 hypothetical protein EXU57_20855 [Segetibacter sp. 3557_3]
MIPRNPIKHLITTSLFICSFLFFSCRSSKEINKESIYFQRGLDSMGQVKLQDLVIQPNDGLSIQIYSKTPNQEQTAMYNLANAGSLGYVVNNNGMVEIAVLGDVPAAGLTRAQLQQSIVDKLSVYIKSPAVLVRFADVKVNVLGEVSAPGIKSFAKERVTIIDAISAAGDLTIAGKRHDVMIIREENGRRNAYTIDLRSGSLFQSPAYQLRQNDIVYVGSTDKKLRQMNRKTDGQSGLQIAMTVLSVATTLIYLISTFFN